MNGLDRLVGVTVELVVLSLDGHAEEERYYGVLHTVLGNAFGVQVDKGIGGGDLICFGHEHVLSVSMGLPPEEKGATIVVRRPVEEARRRVDVPLVERLVRELLLAIGEDPSRPGLCDTPARVARFWREFIEDDPFNNTTFESVKVDEMVIVRGIRGWSLCEHHLLPFSFVANVGYVTGDKVIGLSKVPRIVKACSRKLQLQERLTNDIADALQKAVDPRGVAVVVEGWHTCAAMRGIESRESSMITSCMRGVMLDVPSARAEFMELIK